MSSHVITIPWNTEPESPKLTVQRASQRAAQKADENATSEVTYGEGDFAKFAEPFAAAVASASTEKGRPVTMLEVITAIAETGCKLKIDKRLKERFVWNGFKAGRWQISRMNRAKGALVPFPKGAHMDRHPGSWRFSPSARRPLAELSCEPSPRSSAGCVVC